jgi:hypothetical protein
VHRAIRYLKSAPSILLIALLATGCSKAVEIPRTEIDDPAYREPGSYRIRVQGREEYLVRRFSISDSTIVVEELLPSDERFRTEREDLPTSIPLVQVESISRMETNGLLTAVVLTPIVIVGALMVWFILDQGGGMEGTDH